MNPKKRKARLQELLKRMEAGEDIAQRDLKKALTVEQCQTLQDAWKNEKEWRKQFAEKPEPIKEYEALLKKALFIYNRGESYSGKARTGGKRTYKNCKPTSLYMNNLADTKFEIVVERLQEILNADPSLRIWFDRKIDFNTHGHEPGISPIQIPRVITSRSLDNLGNIRQKNKRALKREAIENSLIELEQDEERAKKGITKEQEKTELQTKALARVQRLKKLQDKIK